MIIHQTFKILDLKHHFGNLVQLLHTYVYREYEDPCEKKNNFRHISNENFSHYNGHTCIFTKSSCTKLKNRKNQENVQKIDLFNFSGACPSEQSGPFDHINWLATVQNQKLECMKVQLLDWPLR